MTKKQLVIHILTISIGFGFFAYWFKIPQIYFISLLILASLLSSKFAKLIVKSWIALGKKLGQINGTIILTLLFFLLLWPLSLLKKLVQTKPLKNKTSRWVEAAPITDFKRPF
ncbi:MAG: hypothetical protein K9H61_05675 [Bacteroidia bacterium]|nr:hypothetical protein [Bacteroidia bacterium]MCF8427050.1 hypothetical protein [Bacteroidia bacterium]MCF8446466.1 hypothetical protein [Bacteroidia bacterium]